MDERFTLLIEKMELLTERADQVQKEIENKFASVSQTQQEIDGKVEEINLDIKSITDEFISGTDSLKKQLAEDSHGKIEEVSSFLSNAESLLNETNAKYQKNVEALVLNVSEKSKEIFEIYDELEAMRSAQTEFNSFLEESKKQFTVALNTLNSEYREVMKKNNFKELVSQMNDFYDRIGKLEKHAHKHAFGGTKI
jgi:hypothetical protein